MNKKIEGKQNPASLELGTNDHFGTCPICHKSDGFFNVGRDHWFFCDEHQMRWCTGSNLFRSWREENQETWEQNKLDHGHYLDVSPQYED